MIYLAQPYSHHEEAIRAWRYDRAVDTCAALAVMGAFVYSPIIHWHEAARRHQLPKDALFWWLHNKHMIDQAGKLYLLDIPGLRQSTGTRSEVVRASELNLPIYKVHLEYVPNKSLPLLLISECQANILTQFGAQNENHQERGPR